MFVQHTSLRCTASSAFSIIPRFIKVKNRLPSHRRFTHTKMYFDEEISLHVAEKIHPSVVRIVPTGVRNMTAEGSGFVVINLDLDINNDGNRSVYILTAAHVVSGSKSINVHFSENSESPKCVLSANVVAYNDRMDLALLHISESHDASTKGDKDTFIPSPLPFTSQTPKVGQLAFANGYLPNRKQMEGIVMTSGIVCGLSKGVGSNREDSNTTYILTNAGMTPGMSGGPVVDKNGFVIGVNCLIRLDLGTLGNCAISAQDCVDFIQHAFQSFSKKSIGYKVLLYNDSMNKRQRVSQILSDVAELNSEDANVCMMLAHNKGVGVVKEFFFSEDDDDDDVLSGAKKLCEDLRNEDILSAFVDK